MNASDLSPEDRAAVAATTKRAHENGFERGTVFACNTILAFMAREGLAGAAIIKAAWEDGSIIAPAAPVPAPPTVPPAAILLPGEIGGPQLDRKQARLSGYTGDVCTNCQSLQVKRNGSCLVCEACGTTTGCS